MSCGLTWRSTILIFSNLHATQDHGDILFLLTGGWKLEVQLASQVMKSPMSIGKHVVLCLVTQVIGLSGVPVPVGYDLKAFYSDLWEVYSKDGMLGFERPMDMVHTEIPFNLTTETTFTLKAGWHVTHSFREVFLGGSFKTDLATVEIHPP